MIALVCDTAARAPETAGPDFLALVAGALLIAGGLLAQRIGRW